MSLLARILDTKRTEIESGSHRQLPPWPALRPIALKRGPAEPVRILAEIKQKSPSAGQLPTHLTIQERAAAYERAGCSMISVLCDHEFFGGSYEHLSIVRQACTLPILCKEFVIDERQLDWARAYGADAVLLIARCVDRSSLRRLHAAATARGLQALVEVSTADEARTAVELEAPLIGVNARDLDTLEMDPERARRILQSLPTTAIRVHLSGLKRPQDVAALRQSGIDAALIGEVLMRSDDLEPLLRGLVQAAGRD
jgi:indole-3-glycerol phosphate synthase